MSLIKTTPPEQAEGKLAELYASAEQFFGFIPNNVRLLGVSPTILDNQFSMVEYYMSHKTLKTPLLAGIRMMVSKRCRSEYCENANTQMLIRMGVPKEKVEACKADPQQAPFSDNEKAMLGFVLKAVEDPKSVTAQDVEALKTMGWTDQDIFDAVAHGARMVGTNIIFDTFKIDRD
ncbi:MAG: hypothetical protein AB1646_01995 [Thermodesulfobacteriota bacterium]